MKHSQDESKRRLRRGRYATAFVTTFALALTLIAPGTAGDGGMGGRSGEPLSAPVSDPVAVSETAVSDGGGQTSGSSDADPGKAPGTVSPDEDNGASAPAAPDSEDRAPAADKPSKKTEEERTPKERAVAEREIERKTVAPEPDEEHEGYIVVMSDDGVASLADAAGAAEEAGYSASASGTYVRVDEPLDVLDFAEAADVDSIVPNYRIYLSDFPEDAPNDPKWKEQWNLRPPESATRSYGIDASALYERGLDGDGVSVGIFDTGLGANSDFSGYEDFVSQGLNFVDTTNWGEEPTTASHEGLPTTYIDKNKVTQSWSWYHGTMVTGFIAAGINNGDKIAGLVDGVDVYPYRIFNEAFAEIGTLSFGLDYLLEKGKLPDVINMSIGTDETEQVKTELQKLFDKVAAKGTIVVASAGNNEDSSSKSQGSLDYLSYPAAFDSVISVGASDQNGNMTYFSQENEKVDIAAPGSGVLSLYPGVTMSEIDGTTVITGSDGSGGSVSSGSGTSYSAPLVAGVAVAAKQLARKKGLELDVYAFRDLIKNTSRKIRFGSSFNYGPDGHSDSYGYGLIDPNALLSYLEQSELRSISYDLDGGYFDKSCVPVSFATMGALASGVPLPTDPDGIRKEGYTFAGWYAEGASSPVVKARATMLSGSDDKTIKLTAHWTNNTVSFTASDFMISSDYIAEIEDAGYDDPRTAGDDAAAKAGYARAVVSLSALAGVKLGAEDTVTDACPYTSFYISKLKDPVGVYPVAIVTAQGGYAIVAMSIYDSDSGKSGRISGTLYNSGGGAKGKGAFVTADTRREISVALSAVATADLAALADARAFTWQRSDTEISGVTGCTVNSGGLKGVTAPGTYTAWVAPAGHETNGKLTFSVLVTDDGKGDGKGDGNGDGNDAHDNNNRDAGGDHLTQPVQSYFITFMAPESVTGAPPAMSIGHNQTIPALPIPVRPGYEFISWLIEGTNTWVSDGGRYDYGCDVRVTAKWRAKSFSIQAGSPVRYAPVGESISLKTEFSGDALTPDDQAVNWAVMSYGGTAATIGADTGLFTAGSKEGVAIIRVASVHLPYIYNDLAVVVAQPVEKVSIPLKNIYLSKGDSFSVNASAYGAKSASVNLTWSSSNGNIATVTASGKVRAQGNGTAVVTAKSMNGKSSSITVKVVNKAVKVEKIRAGGYPKTMKRGRTAQLTVSVSPTNAVFTEMGFTSSKPSVLSVDKAGKLTAKRKGVATVTVKVGNKSQKIKIRVK
jgi:uncharacterized repeat protein (TIGR02543 family)